MTTTQGYTMKQTKPFSVVLSNKFKASLIADKRQYGIDRGVFFSTSGKTCVERINPTRQYEYIFTTEGK